MSEFQTIVTSNIDCPQKRRKEKESPRSCDKIGFTTKLINQEGNMGRLKSITPLVCAHSHFTYEERLQLEFHLSGTGKLPKITNLTMLGTLLHKHPRTIRREIDRGLVEHLFDEGLQTRLVYNADYAENIARAKDSGKGPDLKLGRDYALAKEIGRLMKELHYSPYAVLAHFDDKGWPTDTRICEKTLYSYVYGGLIPDVSDKRIFFCRARAGSLREERGTTEMLRWRQKASLPDRRKSPPGRSSGTGKETPW